MKKLIAAMAALLGASSFAAYNPAFAIIEGVMNPAAPAHVLFYAHNPAGAYNSGTTVTEYTSGTTQATRTVYEAGTWHLFVSWVDAQGVHAQFGDVEGVQVYAGKPTPQYQVNMTECAPVQVGTKCSVNGDANGL